MAETLSDTPDDPPSQKPDAARTPATEPTQVASTEPAAPAPPVDEDRPPELAGPYEEVAADAMPQSLLDDDRKTGRVITIMLCSLFTYVLIAMGYVVYVTWQWTR